MHPAVFICQCHCCVQSFSIWYDIHAPWYVRTLISPFYFCFRYTICFSYCIPGIIFCFYLFSSWGNFSLQICWSLSCDHGLHCSHELMWEQQQKQYRTSDDTYLVPGTRVCGWRRPLNVAEHKTLVVSAGGHWTGACLLRYQRICYFMTDWNMYVTLSEGKKKGQWPKQGAPCWTMAKARCRVETSTTEAE